MQNSIFKFFQFITKICAFLTIIMIAHMYYKVDKSGENFNLSPMIEKINPFKDNPFGLTSADNKVVENIIEINDIFLNYANPVVENIKKPEMTVVSNYMKEDGYTYRLDYNDTQNTRAMFLKSEARKSRTIVIWNLNTAQCKYLFSHYKGKIWIEALYFNYENSENEEIKNLQCDNFNTNNPNAAIVIDNSRQINF